ncbi:MAG: hypothetical protein U0Z75_09385 [Deinococcaceae bacterium]
MGEAMMLQREWTFVRSFELKTFEHTLFCDFFVEVNGIESDIKVYTVFHDERIYLGHTNSVRFEDSLQIFFETLEEEHHPEQLKDWARGEKEPFVGLYAFILAVSDGGYEEIGSPSSLIQVNFSMTELKFYIPKLEGEESELHFRWPTTEAILRDWWKIAKEVYEESERLTEGREYDDGWGHLDDPSE